MHLIHTTANTTWNRRFQCLILIDFKFCLPPKTWKKWHFSYICHADQVKKKETEGEEVMKDKENTKEKMEVTDLKTEDKDKEEEKQLAPEGCSQEEQKIITEDEAKVPRAQRRPKALQIKVTLLDNTFYECELDVRAF